MTGMRSWSRSIACIMVTVMALIATSPGVAQVTLVSTEQILAESESPTDRARVVAFLERADVREQMVALGVAPIEALARVEALSDAEVAEIAGRLDHLPAGQGFFSAPHLYVKAFVLANPVATVIISAVLVFPDSGGDRIDRRRSFAKAEPVPRSARCGSF